MNLLEEGIAQKVVEKTTLTRKLTVGGLTNTYPVYKIRLDYLFYNDQNDRIATWISQYKVKNEGQAPDCSDKKSYNDIIEKFIFESNPDAIHKTQNNIEMVDQREPGVVLTDGRIIDGNRRFTCLRRLSKKNDRFGYFETVILNHNIEHNAKQIKMLELSIQHGEESKVDYNPIERLVGIYNDIITTQLLSIEEYARSTNETENEVKKRVAMAKLMVEFLEFINAPGQFYMARDLQLYSLLEELLKLINKCRSEDEIADLKNVVFSNIVMQPTGDMTRFVRNIKSVIGTDYQDNFLEEQREIAEKVLNIIPEQGKVTIESIREVRKNDEIVQELERSMEKTITKVRKNETKNKPIRLAENATIQLEGIDTHILQKMNDSELQRLIRQLDILEQTITKIRENL